MAKARIMTAEGAEVNLEGSPSEIAAVLKELEINSQPQLAQHRIGRATRRSGRTTLGGLLDELIGDQFFKKPKAIGEVRKQLANLGHHYPVTSLSGPMMGYVRKRKLRRFKESGKYMYSQ